MQNLDEIQSYILLRRWSTEDRSRGPILESLDHQQLLQLKAYYAEERALLLSCLGELLQTDSGSFTLQNTP